MTYAEAVDGALCYGWIDGLKHSHDTWSWTQKFTPRRPKSLWSKRNTEHVARLIKARRMKSAGLKEVEAAKQDGRWTRAYDSANTMTIPKDFLAALAKNTRALAFFRSLNKSNTYAIAWRLHTAKKPETRAKRMADILARLAREEKFH